jgi:hypothetical protein
MEAREVFSRVSATRAITREVILLYWDIGQGIVEKQTLHAWGESVIDQVAVDLRNSFPGSTDYSPRNLATTCSQFARRNSNCFAATACRGNDRKRTIARCA